MTALKATLKGVHASPSSPIDVCYTLSFFVSFALLITSPSCSNILFIEGHYQVACVTLVSGDLTQSPLGSDKEDYDDEAEIIREG